MMRENQLIVIERHGASFRDCTAIVTEPWPEPGPGEVVLRHDFAGVNGVYDQMMCLDRVEHTRVTYPAPAGVEAVGRVDSVGPGVSGWREGDAAAVVRAGFGYRLAQRCPAAQLIPIPEPSPKVLALVPTGVSALLALEQVGEMREDEVVCVSAAAGGLGHIAVQLAVQAGNEVVAICGSDRKADGLKRAGARRVIQYRREDPAAVLADEYPDGLDLVLDSVGGALFDALVDSLAPHGRLVVAGFTADRLPTEKPSQERIYAKLYWKAASVRGFMNYRFEQHAAAARTRLFDMLESGVLAPWVDDKRFSGLASVPDAVEHLLAGCNLGKVLVELFPGARESKRAGQ